MVPSVFADCDRCVVVRIGGSGVSGVVAFEASERFTLSAPSRTSPLPADFIIFGVGRVPSGAMFATVPPLANPASAKLGRAAGKAGSLHMSVRVFCLGAASVIVLGGSEAALPVPFVNGLE